jgi:hypothetical protein
LRTERSAFIALIEARDAAPSPLERARRDFELVRAGNLGALLDLKDLHEKAQGFTRYQVRRDIIELGRRARIGAWKVTGPFASSRWEDGINVDLPAELRGGAGARWRVATPGKSSYLNLRETMDPSERSGAHARLRVRARHALSTCLLLESVNALRVFLNGREVLMQGPHKEGKAPLHVIPVDFAQGENEVLVRCVVETGAWGFQTLVVDPEGALLPGEE